MGTGAKRCPYTHKMANFMTVKMKLKSLEAEGKWTNERLNDFFLFFELAFDKLSFLFLLAFLTLDAI